MNKLNYTRFFAAALVASLFGIIVLGSAVWAKSTMAPLKPGFYEAVSLGRSAGSDYPVHVAVIDARTRDLRVTFPNFKCGGVLRPKGFPEARLFRRWPVLRQYKGITQFKIDITQGSCPMRGEIVLQNGVGGNCLFCDGSPNLSYFYFHDEGGASGADLAPSRYGASMTAEDAEDIIDRARLGY